MSASEGVGAILADLEVAKAFQIATCSSRPFVLVTWAQTADGYIAAAPGKQTFISCEETGLLTHELRARCDSILVGSGTVTVDNPRLNTRVRGQPASGQPTAVVLDRAARTSPDAAIVSVRVAENVPVLIYFSDAALRSPKEVEAMPENVRRIAVPVAIAASPAAPSSASSGLLDLSAVLSDMKSRGIESVMVEGGSQVINSFLRDEKLCDYVIVTIAPRFLGNGVLGVQGHQMKLPVALTNTAFEQVGIDTVLRGRVCPSIDVLRPHGLRQTPRIQSADANQLCNLQGLGADRFGCK
jgi:riboflavin-specific deaminase-like protein